MSTIIIGYHEIQAEVRNVRPFGVCGSIGTITHNGQSMEVAKLHSGGKWWVTAAGNGRPLSSEDAHHAEAHQRLGEMRG